MTIRETAAKVQQGLQKAASSGRLHARLDAAKGTHAITLWGEGARLTWVWRSGQGQGFGHLEASAGGQPLTSEPRTIGWKKNSPGAWWLGANLSRILDGLIMSRWQYGAREDGTIWWRAVADRADIRDTGADLLVEVSFDRDEVCWAVTYRQLRGCIVSEGTYRTAYRRWRKPRV